MAKIIIIVWERWLASLILKFLGYLLLILTHAYIFKDLLLKAICILKALNEYLHNALDLFNIILKSSNPIRYLPLIVWRFRVPILWVRSWAALHRNRRIRIVLIFWSLSSIHEMLGDTMEWWYYVLSIWFADKLIAGLC